VTATTNTLDSQDRRGTHSGLTVEGPNPAPTSHDLGDAQNPSAGGGGPNIRSDHSRRAAHRRFVAAEQSPHPATHGSTATEAAPGGAQALEPTKRHSLPTEVASVRGSTPPAPGQTIYGTQG
jgi:hypothetical protein